MQWCYEQSQWKDAMKIRREVTDKVGVFVRSYLTADVGITTWTAQTVRQTNLYD